jgi:hypothetical protein
MNLETRAALSDRGSEEPIYRAVARSPERCGGFAAAALMVGAGSRDGCR